MDYSCLQNSIDTAYKLLGAHKEGNHYRFSVYAPAATSVCLIGTFNNWTEQPMEKCDNGVWSISVSATNYEQYKFVIYSGYKKIYKADPFAFYSQTHGQTNSIVFDSAYVWNDDNYISHRCDRYDKPINIYEMHLDSWLDKKDGTKPDYLYLAKVLPPYLMDMGYNYVEFMPLTEYPLDDSWGYQVTGYFSATSRYGNPDQLRALVDSLHQVGIGVIIDWVPAHFCKDEHGLIEFDGSYLYESANPYRREHEEWGTRIFDTSKPYVRTFLLSSANYWLTEFHFDGIRVDAVASMLYLDYGKKDAQWQANKYGGKENLENIDFFRTLSCSVFANNPHALLIAEESTAFPLVTGPADKGGLGFNFKWNMGWMNDTLSYFSADYNLRDYYHDKLTFPTVYAYSENYLLPLSHDEVVHGKCSLINKQPGCYEQKFNGIAVLTAFQYAFPGKKLTFMGNEFAQFIEWNFRNQLDWVLLNYPVHAKYHQLVKRINHIYLQNPALYERDTDSSGFVWVKGDDRSGVYAFLRVGNQQTIFCLFNTSPTGRKNYRLDLPEGDYDCILSTIDRKRIIHGKGAKTVLQIAPLSAYYFVKRHNEHNN